MMAKKFTYEDVKSYFKDNDCILLSKSYYRNDIPLDYICSCGNVSKIQFRSFKVGSRCEHCRRNKIAHKKKHSYEEVAALFKKRGYELLENSYKKNSVKMKYRCVCGNISYITFATFRNGGKCNSCEIERKKNAYKYSIEYVRELFLNEGCELLEDGYINSKTPMKYRCKCGRKSYITLDNFSAGKRCMGCAIEGRTGENASNYNHDLTYEERQTKRLYEDYYKWRKAVFERDAYTCKVCNKKGVSLNAHHLDGYNWCRERRTDVSNGVTLCKECHTDFHIANGFGNNTETQYIEWLRSKRNKDAI